MGYYSAAALAIHESVMTSEMKDTIIKAEPDLVYVRDNAVIFKWEHVKWYNLTDPVVMEVVKLFNTLDDEKFGFIRIGEDREDIEEIGCPDDFGFEVYYEISIYENREGE
jgi:hypothetical protein